MVVGNFPLNSIAGKVALVTGASKGIGKGISRILVESGVTVYGTGRKHNTKGRFPDIMQTSDEMNSLKAGQFIGRYCDQRSHEDIYALFKDIQEKHGSLDILVNCSFGGGDHVQDVFSKKFWESDPVKLWSDVIDASLRSTYICSTKATELMIPKGWGLIVNISSIGGLIPVFGPLYSAGKEATDRLSVNMGRELAQYGITVVSLWPGIVKTEGNVIRLNEPGNEEMKKLWPIAETPDLIGKVVAGLAKDPEMISKSGKVHFVADLAHEYDACDVTKNMPVSFRSLKFAAFNISPRLSQLVPGCIKVPASLLEFLYGKH